MDDQRATIAIPTASNPNNNPSNSNNPNNNPNPNSNNPNPNPNNPNNNPNNPNNINPNHDVIDDAPPPAISVASILGPAMAASPTSAPTSASTSIQNHPQQQQQQLLHSASVAPAPTSALAPPPSLPPPPPPPSQQQQQQQKQQQQQFPPTANLVQALLSPQIIRSLGDKVYEKRKAAAIEIERLVRDALVANDHHRIAALLAVLAHEFAYSIVPNTRNGGLIALAAAAIALGPAVDRHLSAIVPPMLACFADQDSRVRYYASEAMYNVCKVARSSILIYFNELFDALCKLSVDPEGSVKSGAGLLDRIIKDIVAERSAYYHPELERRARGQSRPSPSPASAPASAPAVSGAGASFSDPSATAQSSLAPVPVDAVNHPLALTPPPAIYPPVPGTVPLRPGMSQTTFNLPRFIPLLAERIYAVTPAARIFLVQWIFLLHSIPDLELISYLPDFLDGLFRFLSDPNVDVRTTTLNVLGEFLKEIRDVVTIQRENGLVMSVEQYPAQPLYSPGALQQQQQQPQSGLATTNNPSISVITTQDSSKPYVPGQAVVLSFGRMTKILIPHLSSQDEETQATALRWTNEFLLLARPAMIPFVPSILRPVLRTLSHSVATIRNMAADTNVSLFSLVLEWDGAMMNIGTNSSTNATTNEAATSVDALATSLAYATTTSSGSNGPSLTALPSGVPVPDPPIPPKLDVIACVHVLTELFQDEREEARAAAIDWISMLHKKAPQMIMHSSDHRLFQTLLGALSDQSEEVVKRDLQLLAQISHTSDDQNFAGFVHSLLSRFASDRRLLESRGSLIIRQLCFSLSPDRMYRAFAELIERGEDLEFASMMVQNLNLILMTAPELVDLRRRLRHLDSRDGTALFSTLYRSWSHNAVAVFSLCLLAQAYEHAAALVTTFGDLDINVPFLVQIDKLVQMLESPVFTYLRLQLLEPDRHPHLFKCLYGILMLLPQSSAFATLRNRLNSVGPLITLYNRPSVLASGGGGHAMSSSNLGGGGGVAPTTGNSNNHGIGSNNSSTSSINNSSGPSTPQLSYGSSRMGRTRSMVTGSALPTSSSSSSNIAATATIPSTAAASAATTSNTTTQPDHAIRWPDLLGHFRSIQHRHERSRRQAARSAPSERAHRHRQDHHAGTATDASAGGLAGSSGSTYDGISGGVAGLTSGGPGMMGQSTTVPTPTLSSSSSNNQHHGSNTGAQTTTPSNTISSVAHGSTHPSIPVLTNAAVASILARRDRPSSLVSTSSSITTSSAVLPQMLNAGGVMTTAGFTPQTSGGNTNLGGVGNHGGSSRFRSPVYPQQQQQGNSVYQQRTPPILDTSTLPLQTHEQSSQDQPTQP